MAPKPSDDSQPNEDDVKGKFKSWVNEVLDEREKAANDKREADEKKAAEEDEKRKSREPLALLKAFIGA